MRWLLGLLCVGLAGLWPLALPAARADEDVTRYLPADADMVVYVNVQQLLDSAMVKKHALEPVKSALKDNKDAQQALAALGLDPLHDIHALHLASQANVAPKLLLVVKGNFNLEKLHAAAADYVKQNPDRAKLHAVGDLKIYEITEADQTGFVLILDKQTILIGKTKDYLVDASRQKEARLRKELQALVKDQDPRQSLWFAGLATDEIRKQVGGDPRTAALAGKITAVSGHILVTDEIALDILLHTTDARSATTLGKFLGDLKGVAVIATQNIDTYGQLISRVLEAFKVSTDKSVVILSARITEQMIDKGLKKDK